MIFVKVILKEKSMISNFKDKDKIEECLFVNLKSIHLDRNLKPYLSVNLSDNSGSINARIWENAEELAKDFETGDVIFVKGHIQSYQNKLQLVVHNLRPAKSDEYDISKLIKTASKSSEELMNELNLMIEKVKHPQIKQLITETLSDTQVTERLLKYPAARTIHHAYFGGLLEHTVSISKTLSFLSETHKQLNYDYLIFGAIFHDIGKLWELSTDNGFNYSTEGRLVGHMQLACELVDKNSAKILEFTDELKYELKHIILSHHGRLEYGSPKRPKFLEAMVVAMVDELDSKINTLTRVMTDELAEDKKWSSYDRSFDRYFYLDILSRQLESDK